MKSLGRWVALLALSVLALQLFFVLRIACMAMWNPQSTTFQRSEAWRIQRETGSVHWSQHWVSYSNISENLKRAVIVSEDDAFTNHDGVNWTALEKAWEKNAKNAKVAQAKQSSVRPPKIVGGSTITQQLAKNLLLCGERTLVRKGQEFVLTLLLESMLPKQRILEIYLNNVEWGAGVFGAEAAAQHYFHKPATQLTALEAARLAVMLPRPRYFEKLPNSAYLVGRSAVIARRMGDVELP